MIHCFVFVMLCPRDLWSAPSTLRGYSDTFARPDVGNTDVTPPRADAPRAVVPRALHAAIERVTGESRVDEATPLAELGVDSLRGLQLVQAIRSEYGKTLLHADILSCETVGSLVQLVQEAEPDATPTPC